MIKYIIVLVAVLGLANTASASRCIGVRPICTPGTEPICICESDISLNCKWICASPGILWCSDPLGCDPTLGPCPIPGDSK